MKNMKMMLILSLCVNLVLLGLLAGGAWRGHNMRPQNGSTDEVGAILSSAPSDLRDELHNKFRATMLSHKDQRHGLAQLADIIAATPFNADALSDYFAASRVHHEAFALAAHGDLVDAIAHMNEQDRQDLAARLKALKPYKRYGNRR